MRKSIILATAAIPTALGAAVVLTVWGPGIPIPPATQPAYVAEAPAPEKTAMAPATANDPKVSIGTGDGKAATPNQAHGKAAKGSHPAAPRKVARLHATAPRPSAARPHGTDAPTAPAYDPR